MTKTEPMTVFFVSKEVLARSVDDLLERAGSGYTLTMTIRRSKSGEFCVSGATLHSVDTSP